MGKYLAALSVILVLLAGTLVYLLLLAWAGQVEWGPVITGYLGLVLMTAGFISLGLFASALTQNQIIAAVVGFGALLMFWIIGWAGSVSGPQVGKAVNYLSLLEHLDPFTKGVLDTRDLLYFLNFSAFFIFLTLRGLDSRKMRG
jgi:ABC-2 type transport system permease protein